MSKYQLGGFLKIHLLQVMRAQTIKKKRGVKIKAEREPKRHRLNDGEEEIGSEICTHLADTRSYSTPSELAWALGRRTRQR